MARKDHKLRAALDRHKGRDYVQEKQKKQVKQAEKRKQVKGAHRQSGSQIKDSQVGVVDEEEEDFEAEAGIAADGDDNDWESEDTEEEARAGFDMSRLEDSDSDSDDEDVEDESTRKVRAALASLKTNGIPAPRIAKTTTSASKPLKSVLKSTASVAPNAATNLAQVNGTDDQVGEKDDANDSDIPLSELGSDTEDLVPHRRLTINNTAALTRALSSFALPLDRLPFSEHQSVTTSEPVSIPDIDDDLNRELAFYSQSLSAVKEARRLLKAEGVPFSRPADYFAEMVKSDEHMGKVKGKLLDDAAAKKASADARKQRELRKFGKQVQQERLKERAATKKQMLDKVNVLKRKRQGAGLEGQGDDDMFNVELEEAVEGTSRDKKRRKDGLHSNAGAGPGQPNAKRAKKNEKFGFGGKKRFKKSGDAISSGDMRGFSAKKMKGQAKSGASKRPGKARRAKSKA